MSNILHNILENNLKYPPCTVEDLFCLKNHNSKFLQSMLIAEISFYGGQNQFSVKRNWFRLTRSVIPTRSFILLFLLDKNVTINTEYFPWHLLNISHLFLGIFNNMIPNMAHSFFETNESGILCDCKADCIHQMYIAEGTVAEES